LLDAHADAYPSRVGFFPIEIVGVLFVVAVWFLIGLAFLMIAARIVTRVVLDEVAKDRGRRAG